MNILLLGNDGRAHAFAWKLLNSPLVHSVVCAPGNGGTAPLAAHATIDPLNPIEIARWCFDEHFDLVLPADSSALHAGLSDEALSLHIGICGPPKRTVALEQSRCQTKEFFVRYGIPTAAGKAFYDLSMAERYLASQQLPLIIKADHPSGGEEYHHDRYTALEGLRTLFAARPLEAERAGVVIESQLSGPRVILSAFSDGKTIVPLLPVRLYDRVGEADSGLYAHGIGAHTGSSNYARQLGEYLHQHFLAKIIEGLAAEGLPTWGIIGVDCIITTEGPRATALRFALRIGEAEVILPRLNDDLLPWLQAMLAQRLHELPAPHWFATPSVGLGLVARGYPVSFPYGGIIHGLDELDEGVLLFHQMTANPAVMIPYTPHRSSPSGTNVNQTLGRLFGMSGVSGTSGLHSTGGHVMTIVAQGATLTGARGRALINAERVQFDGRSYREDIGAKEFS